MTVSYNCDAATSGFWFFFKVMLRWRGSLWKVIYVELAIWCLLFTLFSLIYRLALSEDQKITFEKACRLLNKYGEIMPVTFMLGYYVSLVITRWSNFWKNVGWVDNLSLQVASYVGGFDERSLMLRRTIMRYMCCMQVLSFRTVSLPVKKRFPTLDTLVDAGYLTKEELGHVADDRMWLMAKWAMALVAIARKEGRIKSDQAVQQLFDYICELRGNVQYLFWNDWVPVPLAYTQVIFVITRLYFLIMVIGRQMLNTQRYPKVWPVDPYVPVLTIIQFTFLVGWSKVAEALLNPFGEDDDDYEMNYIIDRNLQFSMATVSNPEHLKPEICKDKFFEDLEPTPFYSLESVDLHQTPHFGSAVIDARHKEKDHHQPTVMVKRGSAVGKYKNNTQAALLNAGILVKTDDGIRVNQKLVHDDSQRRYSSPSDMVAIMMRRHGLFDSHQISCPSNLDKHNLCPVNEDDEVSEDQQLEEPNLEMAQRARSATSPFPYSSNLYMSPGDVRFEAGPSAAASIDSLTMQNNSQYIRPRMYSSNDGVITENLAWDYTELEGLQMRANDSANSVGLTSSPKNFDSFYCEQPAKVVKEPKPCKKQDASCQTTFLLVETMDVERLVNELRDVASLSRPDSKGNFTRSDVGCQTRSSMTSISSFTSAETDLCDSNGKGTPRFNKQSKSTEESDASTSDSDPYVISITVNRDL